MADAGTSAQQDRRFSDKELKLLKTMKFPPEFDKKIDMRNVNLTVIRPWVAKKVVELVGFEDELVVEYTMGLLEDQQQPNIDPKRMQINLTGFLTKDTPSFMNALWTMLLEAQDSPGGIPRSFVEEKKQEMRLVKEVSVPSPFAMLDPRIIALGAITAVVLVGTIYSVTYNTYLDTSDPLIANLPHPLHANYYFASKSNILNVYFIKRAWAWTSAAYLLLWITTPPAEHPRLAFSRYHRWGKWVVATAIWLAFTDWFFGPAITERVLIASGGECVLSLPSGDVLEVPAQYCKTRTTISPTSHPSLFAAQVLARAGLDLGPDWRGRPRLMRGHDVSGHIFLLTLSVLFLADQLRFSLRVSPRKWPLVHRLAVALNVTLIAVWLFASWTTSVYFHSPLEKLSGYLIGVASFAITQLLLWEPPIDPASETKIHSS